MSARWPVVLLAIVAMTATAEGTKIDVVPGPGALQAAIDAAVPGDVLVLQSGDYDAAVVHVPRLTITTTAARINPDQAAPVGLAIVADGVRVSGGKGPIVYKGISIYPTLEIWGTDAAVTIANVAGARLRYIWTRAAPTTGIDVNASSGVMLSGIWGIQGGVAGAAIRLANLPLGQRTIVKRSKISGRLLIESCTSGAALGRSGILIKGNIADQVTLQDSDGAYITRNGPGAGVDKIELDASSDNNYVVGNTFAFPCTISDAGMGNVFQRNFTYASHVPCP
jgi:hypothetical protein